MVHAEWRQHALWVLGGRGHLPDEPEAIFWRQQNTRASLADALQSLHGNLEIADVENWELKVDVSCMSQQL